MRGFTLLELLLVVTTIAVVAGLLLPVTAGARARARAIRCTANMHDFGIAFAMYSSEWDDFLPPNRAGENVPLGHTWVQGWVVDHSTDATNVDYLRDSLLSKYSIAESEWKCPGDRSMAHVRGSSMPRVRTMSMNYYIGAPWSIPNRQTYQKVSDFRGETSDIWVFTDERSETIDDGTFLVDSAFNRKRPSLWRIIDLPGNFHQRGSGMAFADGHAIVKAWTDRRTIAAPHQFQSMPGNQDLLWLDQHSSSSR